MRQLGGDTLREISRDQSWWYPERQRTLSPGQLDCDALWHELSLRYPGDQCIGKLCHRLLPGADHRALRRAPQLAAVLCGRISRRLHHLLHVQFRDCDAHAWWFLVAGAGQYTRECGPWPGSGPDGYGACPAILKGERP